MRIERNRKIANDINIESEWAKHGIRALAFKETWIAPNSNCRKGKIMKEKKGNDFVETIDIVPKWKNLTPMFFNWLESGTKSQKKLAREEILRLGQIVDTFMAHRKHGGLTCNGCSETFDLA